MCKGECGVVYSNSGVALWDTLRFYYFIKLNMPRSALSDANSPVILCLRLSRLGDLGEKIETWGT